MNMADWNLSLGDLFAAERDRFATSLAATCTSQCAIQDAYNSQMPLSKLVPFNLPVFFKFVELTCIAAEFPCGFFYTMGGWLAHRDLHATLNQLRPDHKARPRIMTALTGDTNCGKSPHFKAFVKPVFLGTSSSPGLVESHKMLFVETGSTKRSSCV